MRKWNLLARKVMGVKTALAVTVCAGYPVAKAELYFNINSLNLSEAEKQRMDLTLLSHTDGQMPGEYDVQVWVNRTRIGEFTLNFVSCETNLCPQLTPEMLKNMGVKVATISSLSRLPADAVISDIGEVIPDAEATFDFGQRRLNLSIPQAALDNVARGYIPPEQWEQGIPMLFTSYHVSGSETRQRHLGENVGSQYVNLRSGANYGPWRLRNESYYSHSNDNGYQWNSTQTWLERDITKLKSRFKAGEGTSPGMLFNAFSFRGLSLSSEDDMLPDSLRGFAPEVRGVAITNATVEIRQNGNLMYQTFVAPGEFVINDLYAVSTSGDLEITIREENGEVRSYFQSFAAPPISVRKGAMKYSATVGTFGTRYYQQPDAVQQTFAQAEFLYGVLNNSSLYGGLISAQHYRSGMLGVGQGLGQWGALSLDVTQANTTFSDGSKQQGQSWRMRYSKRFDQTGTNMTLAGHRYDSNGYYDFDAASNSHYNSGLATRYALKNQSQLTLSQNVGTLGSVALSASQTEYWGQDTAKHRTLSGSWSKSFGGVTVGLNQSQNKNWRTGKTNHVTSANISVPLGKWLTPDSNKSLRMSNSMNYSDSGITSLNSTLSGTALENNNLFYSLTQSHNSQNNGKDTNSTALSGTYQGGRATASLGVADTYGESSRVNWGLRGSIVAHPYGVTLSQSLYEGSSYALVRAPQAGDVAVKNRTGISTDSRGYAIVPSLTPYRENTIALDTATLGDDVDLTTSMHRKVPTREALVLADFETRIGHRVFLTLTHAGKPLPLGVMVSAGDNSNLTNEKGQLFLSGIAHETVLNATLPEGNRCETVFNRSKATLANGIFIAELECV